MGQNAVVYHKDDFIVPVFMAKFMGNLPFVLAKPATEHSLVIVNMPSDHESQQVTVNMNSILTFRRLSVLVMVDPLTSPIIHASVTRANILISYTIIYGIWLKLAEYICPF